MKTLKAEMKQAAHKSWYWHLKAGNNRIVLVSETYGSRWECIRSMEMVRRMVTGRTAWDTYNGPMSNALESAINFARMKVKP